MNLFAEAFAWIFSADRLSGSLPLPLAIWQHLAFTFGSVAIAALIAIPLGWLIGHTGRGREIAVALSGAARALPSQGSLGGSAPAAARANRPAACHAFAKSGWQAR